MIAKSIATVIREADQMETIEEKVRHLQKYDAPPVRAILCMALDPEVVWDLPNVRPPFNPNELKIDQESMLYNEMRRMYLFLKGPNKIFGNEFNPNVTSVRREQLFIQLLEALQADDAELVCCALEKTTPYKTITPEVINMAYPGLMSNG